MLRHLSLSTPHGRLFGSLLRTAAAPALVLLVRAHHTPADAVIAEQFSAQGFAVLRMELLTHQEMQFADATQNVPRLSQRLLDILEMIHLDDDMRDLPLILQAHGDTTPAALRAAAQRDTQIKALACHGGLADRAGLQALQLLAAPLLMQFDADDTLGLASWERVLPRLNCPHQLQTLAPGDDGVVLAARWFADHA